MEENKSTEVKEGMKALADSMEKSNEEMKMIGKAHEETKQLVEGLAGELAGIKEDSMAKMQEQIDEIDTNIKSLGSVNAKESKDAFHNLVQSEEFKEFSDSVMSGSNKSNGFSMGLKTSDMTTGNTLAALAGDYIIPQMVRGGMPVHDPEWPRHFREIVPIGRTNSQAITFPVESTINDSTDVRAEGSAMAQTDVDITMTTKAVTNISAYSNVTRDFLADAPAFESYLKGRLMAKLLNDEDDQILNGTDASNQLDGLADSATTATDQLADSDVQRFDVLMAAIVQARAAAYRPNWIVMHPSDMLQLYTTKDGNGMYIYPGDVRTSGQINVLGVPVFEHDAITQTQFLVADLSPENVQLFLREDASIEMWLQDGSNARSREVTITINERLVQAIYRTGALIGGDFDTLLGSGSA